MLYIDLETRSQASLPDFGPYRYTEDPEFRILLVGWSLDGSPAAVSEDPSDVPGLFDPAVPKVAHNAQFERLCLGTLDARLRDPEQWTDTQALAAEYGHPTGLEACAASLGLGSKDSAGKELIRLFTRPKRDGSWNTPQTHPLEWLDFLAYCAQDVDLLADVHLALGDWPNELERATWIADQRINDRGLRIDLDLCRKAALAVEDNRTVHEAEFRELTGVDNPRSVPQVRAWCDRVGLSLPNLQAATVQAALEDPDIDPDHARALRLRQDLALSAGGKFGAALNVASPDGRIRGGFQFFGAHTGRWSGRRVQPQNLPRATVDDPEAAILDLRMDLGADPHTLKALVRSMFLGPLTVVDYASIEARVVAWLANEEWALRAFRDDRDIYVETAERMSTPGNRLTRFQGKVAVLALGYNGGVNSLRAMGAEGDDETLRRLVNVWRLANPRIVKLWELMGDAVDAGGRVGPHLKITRRGETMKMYLPSGRAIHYHGVRWERYTVVDKATGRKIRKEGWRYDDPKQPGVRIGTYGGRLVENATQAVARDLLAGALVRLEAAEYPVVGHVHDEVLVEGSDLEGVTRLMAQQPRWARGLPIASDGFTADRYRKG